MVLRPRRDRLRGAGDVTPDACGHSKILVSKELFMKPSNPHKSSYQSCKRSFALRRAATFLLALLALCSLSLSACSWPPELSSVKDRFAELILASGPVNELLWGDGLPYYDRDSDFAIQNGLYDGITQDLGSYRFVTHEALEQYPSVEAIRSSAALVYSSAFLEDVGTSLFEGNMLVNGEYSALSRARYAEVNQSLCILVGWDKSFSFAPRSFDMDSMQIVRRLSDSEIVTVTVDSTRLDGSDPRTMTLRFVWQEDDWRLDSPTY